MKWTVTLVVLFCSSRVLAQTAPREIANAIVRAEERWNDAWLTRDPNKAKAIVADEYTGVNDDGVFVSKQDHVANFEGTGQEIFTALRVSKVKVRLYDGIAIANGDLHMELTHDGTPSGGDFLFTDVWQQRNGQWQVIASAETPTARQQKRDANKPKVVGPDEFKSAADVFGGLPKVPANFELQIVSAEQALTAAYIKKDYATIQRMNGRGSTDTWPDGWVYGVAQDIDSLKREQTIDSAELFGYVVRDLGSVAVCVGTIHQSGTYRNQRFDENLNFLDIWHREGDEWRIVASHLVEAAKQPEQKHP